MTKDIAALVAQRLSGKEDCPEAVRVLRRDFEEALINYAVSEAGSQIGAATMLGLNRNTIRNRGKREGITSAVPGKGNFVKRAVSCEVTIAGVVFVTAKEAMRLSGVDTYAEVYSRAHTQRWRVKLHPERRKWRVYDKADILAGVVHE